jgi:hypothetical protein
MLCVIYVFEYSHTHPIKYIGTHQELEVKQVKQVSMRTLVMDALRLHI